MKQINLFSNLESIPKTIPRHKSLSNVKCRTNKDLSKWFAWITQKVPSDSPFGYEETIVLTKEEIP